MAEKMTRSRTALLNPRQPSLMAKRPLMPLLWSWMLLNIATAQVPGERPPTELVRRSQIALNEGRRALESHDPDAARAAVAKAIAILGDWAGNPETATRYYPPIATAAFDADKARDWWLREIQRGQRGLPWVKNPTGDPHAWLCSKV